jgi:hypothetical protein
MRRPPTARPNARDLLWPGGLQPRRCRGDKIRVLIAPPLHGMLTKTDQENDHKGGRWRTEEQRNNLFSLFVQKSGYEYTAKRMVATLRAGGTLPYPTSSRAALVVLVGFT